MEKVIEVDTLHEELTGSWLRPCSAEYHSGAGTQCVVPERTEGRLLRVVQSQLML